MVVAQKSFTDHTEFLNAQDDFKTWLTRSLGTLSDCQDVGGTEEAVRLLSILVLAFFLKASKVQLKLKFDFNFINWLNFRPDSNLAPKFVIS